MGNYKSSECPVKTHVKQRVADESYKDQGTYYITIFLGYRVLGHMKVPLKLRDIIYCTL